jgi:hypothetical protein
MSKEIYKINENFSIKIVQNLDEFANLKDVWNSLVEKNESYVPWLSWDWFNLCLKYSLDGNKLFIWLLYKGDSVAGIAPFSIKHETYKGILKAKKIELLGNVYSPIRNFVFCNSRGEAKVTLTSHLIRYFCEVYRDWDILEFDSIPEENDVFKTIKDVISSCRLEHKTYLCFGDWYLNGINYRYDQYFSNLPKAIRKDIQYCQRSLQKKGTLRFELKKDIRSFEHDSNLYDELREKSWKAPEKDRTFHREFEKIAAERGWLRFGFLLHDDNPIASQKWIVCNKRAYILAVLYHEEYHKYSPGKILTSEMAKWVIDEDKVVEIDFMRGDDPYKKDWTPNRRERKGITLFNNTARAQILAFLMTKILPIIERNPHLLSAKDRLLGYLK